MYVRNVANMYNNKFSILPRQYPCVTMPRAPPRRLNEQMEDNIANIVRSAVDNEDGDYPDAPANRSSSFENQDKHEAVNHPRFPMLDLNVRSEDGLYVFFSIRASTRLNKLMIKYCEATSQDINVTDFFFKGNLLVEGDTANDHHMKDGDTIYARRRTK